MEVVLATTLLPTFGATNTTATTPPNSTASGTPAIVFTA
jgi:hypothetical protein